VQYHDGAGRISYMGDCRKHLLLSRWPAFIAGRSQADYLRSLGLHLERLITLQDRIVVVRLENCRCPTPTQLAFSAVKRNFTISYQ
jgi:hypothetical protein